jgi:hypothetical protein
MSAEILSSQYKRVSFYYSKNYCIDLTEAKTRTSSADLLYKEKVDLLSCSSSSSEQDRAVSEEDITDEHFQNFSSNCDWRITQ